jgi:hypothetical protein
MKIVDAKPVRIWLFVHVIRNVGGGQAEEFVQVEGFTLDHAYTRLLEAYPSIKRQQWQMLE